MEERKQIKISLKTFIILIIIFILLIGLGVFVFSRYIRKPNSSSYKNGNSTTTYSDSQNKTKGKEIEYTTEFGYYFGTSNCIENAFVSSYDELETYINQFGEVTIDEQNVLEYFDEEFFENNTIAIEAHDASSSHDSYQIDSVKVDGTEANININLTRRSYGGEFEQNIQFTFIILDKEIENAKFNINVKEVNNTWDHGAVYKPIIYLYPTQDINVSVKLGYKEKITVSYPKYIDGWDVLAKPNGDLKDLKTGRNLYSLYYESENVVPFKVENEGFVVKCEDSVKFLEEKLDILGLTEREAEEFIIYWLPKLESNKYNYIRFATEEEINKNMPLEINPTPDTLIRVIMTFKGIEHPIEVKEQKLNSVERNGFIVVEWGGTELK